MDIYKLLEKHEKKNSYKDELFPTILQKCHKRIELYNNMKNLYTIFTIPKYVIGFPKFNKLECADYILKNLIKNGFDAFIYGKDNDFIYISWENALVKYREDKIIEKNLLEFESAKSIIEEIPKSVDNIKKFDKSIFNNNKKFSLLD